MDSLILCIYTIDRQIDIDSIFHSHFYSLNQKACISFLQKIIRRLVYNVAFKEALVVQVCLADGWVGQERFFLYFPDFGFQYSLVLSLISAVASLCFGLVGPLLSPHVMQLYYVVVLHFCSGFSRCHMFIMRNL